MRCFFLLNGYFQRATAASVTNQDWVFLTNKVLSNFLKLLVREEIHFSSIRSSLRKLEGQNTKKLSFSGFNQFPAIAKVGIFAT